jgi:hypothetical protein
MVEHTEPTPEPSLSRREALKLAAAVAAFGAALGVRPANSIAQGKEEGKGEMKTEGKAKAKGEGKAKTKAKTEGKAKAKGEGKGEMKTEGKGEMKTEGKASGK